MKQLLFFILIPLLGYAQDRTTDSLFGILGTIKEQNKKSLLYSEIAKSYRQTNLDSAIYYANMGYRLAKDQSYNLGIAENVAALGDFYITKDQLEEAKLYYRESLDHFDKENHLFDYTQISMIIGNINLAQTKYFEALSIYQDCLDVSKENGFTNLLPHLYNNLGNLYQEIEDYDDALNNYIQANSLFKAIGDDYSAAITLSNISNIKDILGNSQEAITGYLDVIRLFSVDENWPDMARVYNLIAQIYLEQKDYKKAEEYLGLAISMLNNTDTGYVGPLSIYKAEIFTTAAKLSYYNKDYDKSKTYAYRAMKLSYANSYKENIYENALVLSKIYDENKQLDSALAYNKIYIKYNEEYQSENDLKRITQLKMQYEFDEILKKKEIDEIRLQAEYKRKELMYLGILIVGLLILIITVLLFVNQKAKTAKISLKKENLELEKEKLYQEVEYKKKELASNMMYLVEKNEFLTKIARELIDLKPSSKKDNQGVIQKLINELKLNSNNKIWDEFELRFKEVHSDFYDALSQAFPDLSPNEIKICAFLRLNMSTKEISSITHQSVKSINMARFRLRKKLNIDRDENLITFLTQL